MAIFTFYTLIRKLPITTITSRMTIYAFIFKLKSFNRASQKTKRIIKVKIAFALYTLIIERTITLFTLRITIKAFILNLKSLFWTNF